MSNVWVQPGKFGDVLSLSPILYDDFKRTGKKPVLIVSKEFASILDRLDYIEPHVLDVDWQDLRASYVYAKKNFRGVLVPQIFGKDFPIAKLTPSFQLDQWLRAGRLESWDELPMVVKRPSNANDISRRYINGKPAILYADHSQSSPFSKKDELFRLLADHFSASHQIIRLSEVRLPNPLDLLALFDAADFLVTVETMMLHLSAASTIPTVALIGDSPTRWKGSAWSKRFLAHIRYCDFENRREDIIRAIKAGLNKSEMPKVELFKTAHDYAYNASLIRYDGKLFVTSRNHPDPKHWRTVVSIYDGQKSWPIDIPKFNDHSIEDMRLFEHQGKLHGMFTIARSKAGIFRCVMAYGELVFTGQIWTVQNIHVPKYGKNDFSAMEKNWSPWSQDGKLYCTYQNSPDHIVLELDGSKVVREWKTPAPKCEYGALRGGTVPIQYHEQLLRFCHANQYNKKSDQNWTYHIASVLMEPQPPFAITRISSHPIMTGNERYIHGCPHWKPRCLLPYGAIEIPGGFRVSVGINDSACGTIDLKPIHLNL